MTKLELIDAYLQGSMTDAEKMGFEQELSQNPALHRKYEFQSEVVNALKDARTAQLKNRLNQVEVGGAATSYSIGKIAAMGGLVVLLGLGFLYFSTDRTPEQEQSSTNTASTTNTSEESSNITPEEESVAALVETKDEEVEELPKGISHTHIDKNIVATPSTEQITEENTVSEATTPATTPDFEKPSIIEEFDNGLDNSEEISLPGKIGTEKIYNISNIEIEADNTKRKYSFHYQFKDNKLFLFGAFNQGLYEILEIKGESDRQLYLYYAEKFYAIDENQTKITALETITDEKVVMKLNMIKENKQ